MGKQRAISHSTITIEVLLIIILLAFSFLKAISDFEAAITFIRDYWEAYNNKGLSLTFLNRSNDAIVSFTKSMEINKNVTSLTNRAQTYILMNDFNKGLQDLDQALILDPNYADAYFNRPKANAATGQIDQAHSDINKAISINSQPIYLSIRGIILESKNDIKGAIGDYNLVKESNSTDPAAQAAKAIANSRLLVLVIQTPSIQNTKPSNPNSNRVALVIGNSSYLGVPKLLNPTNDAQAMASIFRKLGFTEVIERYDLSRFAMEQVLREFGDKVIDADWAVVFYAGHGMEIGGRNYLIPVDAQLTRSDHIHDEAVPLDRVLTKAANAKILRLVTLDACRDNPFSRKILQNSTVNRSIGRGLARIKPSSGVLIAYAARDGSVALDGSSQHSPFTEALLANLDQPQLDIRILFSKVRDAVMAKTKGQQEPFTYGSLPGEALYFK